MDQDRGNTSLAGEDRLTLSRWLHRELVDAWGARGRIAGGAATGLGASGLFPTTQVPQLRDRAGFARCAAETAHPLPMSRAAQTTFLAALHADRSLQQALTQPGVLDLAVRIARAAGYEISSGDLMASPAGQVPWSLEDRPPAEGGEIDFDGDGVPDAVMEGGRWVLLDSED